MSISQVALAAYDAGLCVVPPAEDGTKRPDGAWLEYQAERPTRQQVEAWYSLNLPGLAIVQGKDSAVLEPMERLADLIVRAEGGDRGAVNDLRIESPFVEAELRAEAEGA